MSEELKPNNPKNLVETTIRENIERYTKAAIAGLLINSASMNSIGQGLEKDRGEPVIEFVIPSDGGWKRVGGEYEKYNIWVTEEADAFLNKNPIHIDPGAIAKGNKQLENFRGVKIEMSRWHESTVAIHYYNKDGKSVKLVTFSLTEDGGFERREFNY
jgi:hypothetical protein